MHPEQLLLRKKPRMHDALIIHVVMELRFGAHVEDLRDQLVRQRRDPVVAHRVVVGVNVVVRGVAGGVGVARWSGAQEDSSGPWLSLQLQNTSRLTFLDFFS